jgi:hypothetical protein
MSRHGSFHCQICGRRKHLRKNGTVVHHHVGGPLCPGAGYPPIEHDDARLVGYAGEIGDAYERANAAVKRLEEDRANWIDPALIVRWRLLAGEVVKISRRVQRYLDWPERYRRSMALQMQKFGYAWSDPPPLYLVERAGEAKGAGEPLNAL